jgi:hypothetical protein
VRASKKNKKFVTVVVIQMKNFETRLEIISAKNDIEQLDLSLDEAKQIYDSKCAEHLRAIELEKLQEQ